MKTKKRYFPFYTALAALACLLLALNFAQLQWEGIFSGAAAFPWEPLGYGLRRLSLSGRAGNLLAWVLFGAVGLLPLLPLLLRLAKGKKPGSTWLGLPACGAVFGTVYCMINPSLLERGAVGRLLVCGTADSLLVAWGAWTVLDALWKGKGNTSLRSLRLLLMALDAAMVLAAFGTAPASCFESIRMTAAANTALAAADLRLTNGFLIAGAVVRALPYLLNLLLVHRVLMLLEAAKKEPFGETAARAADRLAAGARAVVLVQLSAQAIFHVAQLFLSTQLASTAVSVDIPLYSLIFGAAALLLAKWFAQGRRIREENEGFI